MSARLEAAEAVCELMERYTSTSDVDTQYRLWDDMKVYLKVWRAHRTADDARQLNL